MMKVSICIPCYQQTQYLQKCLDSVFAQDFNDFEVIISDDTPGGTVKNFIGEKYKSGKIKYFKNDRSLGTPANWNAAVEKASGEYIKLLHHDDFFTKPSSLKQFVELLDKNPGSAFAFSATEVWNVPSDKKWIYRCSAGQLFRMRSDPSYLFFRNMIGAPSATIYRSSLKLEYDIQLKWMVDIDFYIRALKTNPNIVMSGEALVCTADNTSGQVTQAILKDQGLQVREHILVLEKIGVTNKEKMILFFDELFTRTGIRTRDELKKVCAVPSDLENFLNEVFAQMGKRIVSKKWRNWFYASRINNKLFKLDKY